MNDSNLIKNSNLDLAYVVGRNINILRNNKKITQLELAELINYSDKLVSKWERGEAIPSYEVILKLAQIFEVPLEYFSTLEHEQPIIANTKNVTINRNTLTVFSVCGLWAVAAIVFVALYVGLGELFWQIFMWSIPASAVICLVFSCIWYNGKNMLIASSILLWTFLLSLYFQFFTANLWVLFLIGLPIQITLIFVKKMLK